MDRHYLITRSSPDDDQFIDQLEDVLDRLESENLVFFYSESKQINDYIQIQVWVEARERGMVRLVDDYTVPARYLIFGSPRAEDANKIMGHIQANLPIISLAELQEIAQKNMARDPKSLILLALGTGETFSRTTYEILQSGLRHSDPEVRFAAVRSVGLTQWSEFIPELKQFSATETVQDIQELILKAIEACMSKTVAASTL
ncbi:hypothetical protein DSM106972_006400 [Dulcicalothrix desertica PCC 7102]|uniref:HEAT repeat domain-containing protein n=1 Tax=Dulcicalothrix desertica PCC 7102 TaxID=232991 RepID=A0A433VVP0_9CYAN|nr:HEAT repeat domain-containing protein [Dulcicalothrix desertica]RUT10145.1 hypothetical protein DSM106972_006400 [Dulcicalothrix desertica PCC 7102]TWH40876.1 hypothetical protein CAL7102_10239 [Dulcicalothrix desertica PCC 7102]